MDKLISDVLAETDIAVSASKSAFTPQIACFLKNSYGLNRGNAFLAIIVVFRFLRPRFDP